MYGQFKCLDKLHKLVFRRFIVNQEQGYLGLRLQLYFKLCLQDVYLLLLIYLYIICVVGLLINLELKNKNNNIFLNWSKWLNLPVIVWLNLIVVQMLKLWNHQLKDKEINMYLMDIKCLFLEVILVELILLWRKHQIKRFLHLL